MRAQLQSCLRKSLEEHPGRTQDALAILLRAYIERNRPLHSSSVSQFLGKPFFDSEQQDEPESLIHMYNELEIHASVHLAKVSSADVSECK